MSMGHQVVNFCFVLFCFVVFCFVLFVVFYFILFVVFYFILLVLKRPRIQTDGEAEVPVASDKQRTVPSKSKQPQKEVIRSQPPIISLDLHAETFANQVDFKR